MCAHKGAFTKMSDNLDPKTQQALVGSHAGGPGPHHQARFAEGAALSERESNLPMIPVPDGADRVTAPNLVFPNVEITVVRNNIGSIITEPLAPDRTVARMAFFFVGDAATDPTYEAGRQPGSRGMTRRRVGFPDPRHV